MARFARCWASERLPCATPSCQSFWGPENPVLGPHTYTFDASFPLAGTYSIIAQAKDEDAGVSKDSEAKWSICDRDYIWVPATAHFENNGGAGECANGYAWLGRVEDHGSGAGPTFYSGRYELGQRGGVVYNGTFDNATAALRDDAVFHYSGHCLATYPEGHVGEKAYMLNCGIKFGDTVLWPETVNGWPNNACGQLRFCFLNACYLGWDGNFVSLAHRIADKGADAVVAFEGHIDEGGLTTIFDDHVWWELAHEGHGVSVACGNVHRYMARMYGILYDISELWSWIVYPPGSQAEPGNTTVIWPANEGVL